jgi:PAS domain S-box-containing protein
VGIGRLFWSVRDAVIVGDAATGTIVLFNPAAEALFGYAAHEVIGASLESLIPERLRTLHRAGLSRYRETGHGRIIDSSAPVQLAALHRTGEEVAVELTLSPLSPEDDFGLPVSTRRGGGRRRAGRTQRALHARGPYVLAIVRDVSERTRAEAERTRLLDRLRALQEAALIIAAPVPPEPPAVVGLLAQIVELAVGTLGAEDGAIVLAEDPAWRDLVPASGPEDGLITLRRTGRPFRQRWRPEGTTMRVLATGEPISVPDTAVPSEFGPYPYLASAGIRSFYMVPLQSSGRIVGRLGLNFAAPGDLPASDREALAIFAAHAATALERVRLAHAQAAHAAAEAAVRARDEFLSVAAHELKTPITSLRGYAQLLMRRFEREQRLDPEATGRALRALDQQSDKLSRLISQLLDVSRLEAGKLVLEREPTDLTQLLRDAVAAAHARTAEHEVVFHASGGPVHAALDPLRMEQVATNLLDNAIKYSSQGGRIDVRVWQPDSGTVAFSVRDHGQGIPKAQQARVFERFYQVTHAAPRPGGAEQGRPVGATHGAGMGLGLYISREIVERHGGTIAVDSPRGGGTRFTVTLPLA